MIEMISSAGVRYVYSRAELEAKGLVENPHMYLGSGWLFCYVCTEYQYHLALSTPGKSDCYEVCKQCENHVSQRIF